MLCTTLSFNTQINTVDSVMFNCHKYTFFFFFPDAQPFFFSVSKVAFSASRKFFLVSEELCDPVEDYHLEWDTGMLFTETNYVAWMIYL